MTFKFSHLSTPCLRMLLLLNCTDYRKRLACEGTATVLEVNSPSAEKWHLIGWVLLSHFRISKWGFLTERGWNQQRRRATKSHWAGFLGLLTVLYRQLFHSRDLELPGQQLGFVPSKLGRWKERTPLVSHTKKILKIWLSNDVTDAALQNESNKKRGSIFNPAVPDWKTYLAKPCINSAGQVGGADSPVSLFSRNVNSNPKPLGPSVPVNLEGMKNEKSQHTPCNQSRLQD